MKGAHKSRNPFQRSSVAPVTAPKVDPVPAVDPPQGPSYPSLPPIIKNRKGTQGRKDRKEREEVKGREGKGGEEKKGSPSLSHPISHPSLFVFTRSSLLPRPSFFFFYCSFTFFPLFFCRGILIGVRGNTSR